MSTPTRSAIVATPCPACPAAIGEDCTTPTGKRASRYHAKRVAAATVAADAAAATAAADAATPAAPLTTNVSFVGHPPIGGTERFFADARRQAFRYGLTERDISVMESRYNGNATVTPAATPERQRQPKGKSTGDFAPDAKVTVLPAMETRQRYLDGRRRDWADLPQDGQTVAELREAGLPLRHLARFVSEGWISIA